MSNSVAFKREKDEMDLDFYAKLKKRKLDEQEMKQLLRDVVIYICYVFIVFTIVYGYRDPNAFFHKEAIKTAVIHGGIRCGVGDEDDPRYKECDKEKVPNPQIDFMKVRDVNDWYFWLLNTLKPNVRVQEWYNGDPPYGLRGYLDDKANRLIGYAIIRQIRQDYGNCKPPKIIRKAFYTCEGDHNIGTEDQRDYCVGWKPKHANLPCNESVEYLFESSESLESVPITAGIRTYGGGGYIQRLKGPIKELELKLQHLIENNWIDNRTRAIFVEFSVYNAQVMIILENDHQILI